MYKGNQKKPSPKNIHRINKWPTFWLPISCFVLLLFLLLRGCVEHYTDMHECYCLIWLTTVLCDEIKKRPSPN